MKEEKIILIYIINGRNIYEWSNIGFIFVLYNPKMERYRFGAPCKQLTYVHAPNICSMKGFHFNSC